jgi:predicted nucleic acid-binding protein
LGSPRLRRACGLRLSLAVSWGVHDSIFLNFLRIITQLAVLHDGERAALALAASRQPIFILIDDWPGRRIAVKKGFPVIGTLGVLDQAARRKLISFADAVEN